MELVILKTKKIKNSKRTPTYHEGDAAARKFERTMTALFQVPKIDSQKSKKGKD